MKGILKYRNHPSIIAIRDKYKISECFKFTEVDQKEIEKEIIKLDVNKASQRSDIPTKTIKENIDIFGDFIGKSYNNTIKASQFYQNLKLADITPAHKKGKKDMKDNYRPVSILPDLLKIFEKLMFKEMSQFLIRYFLSTNVDFEKASVLNNAF